MSYVIQCDFCGFQGEPTGRKYTSPNQWREIRLNEGHGLAAEQSVHACPDCEKKHLWPKDRHATLEELIDVLKVIGQAKCMREASSNSDKANKKKGNS
jgi:predicted RNA-binding Zn-ribbon protein involved in translation (DUF1610 family)